VPPPDTPPASAYLKVAHLPLTDVTPLLLRDDRHLDGRAKVAQPVMQSPGRPYSFRSPWISWKLSNIRSMIVEGI
jgi:hypothetical protein